MIRSRSEESGLLVIGRASLSERLFSSIIGLMAAHKTLPEIKRILRSEKPALARIYGVTELGIFGSYVHGNERSDSDLDVLIDLERPPRITLLGLVELQDHLSSVLGIEVDVAVKSNLRKRIGKRILDEVVLV